MQHQQHGLHKWAGTTQRGANWEVHRGDALAVLRTLPNDHFDCVVTSPPYYWQRDYKVEGQIGLEKTIDEYVRSICAVIDGMRAKLKDTGVVFLNLGDTYYSAKGLPRGKDPKSRHRRFGLRAVDASGLGVPRKTTIGIPWRVALELIHRKWVLRAPIIWLREGSMPEPTAKDRPWRTYEHVFMFSKSPNYWFDRKELRGEEDVWRIRAHKMKDKQHNHSAPFPEALAERCIRVGCPESGTVLDPFVGSGTSQIVAARLNRHSVGIDLSPDFCKMAVTRLDRL